MSFQIERSRAASVLILILTCYRYHSPVLEKLWNLALIIVAEIMCSVEVCVVPRGLRFRLICTECRVFKLIRQLMVRKDAGACPLTHRDIVVFLVNLRDLSPSFFLTSSKKGIGYPAIWTNRPAKRSQTVDYNCIIQWKFRFPSKRYWNLSEGASPCRVSSMVLSWRIDWY